MEMGRVELVSRTLCFEAGRSVSKTICSVCGARTSENNRSTCVYWKEFREEARAVVKVLERYTIPNA